MRSESFFIVAILLFTIPFIHNADSEINIRNNDVEINGTSISSITLITNTTWTVANSPYYIEGFVNINNNVTLSIEPGVSVRFNGYYGIDVYGILNASGTPTNRIEFRANRSVPRERYWRCIRFRDYCPEMKSVINYVNVSSGNDGISIMKSPQRINNTIFETNQRGVYIRESNGSIIENCINIDTSHGYYIEDSENITLRNLTVQTSSGNGLEIRDSKNLDVSLINSTLCDNCGIYLGEITNISLYDSIIYNNEKVGLLISETDNSTFSNISLYNNDGNFILGGKTRGHYNLNISSDCNVDGKPIYYIRDRTNYSFPSDTGFAGVYNSTNITISNLNFSHTGVSNVISYSENISIIENKYMENYRNGIYSWNSENLLITNNSFINGSGFNSIYHTNIINIVNNSIHNTLNGGYFESTENITIENNTMYSTNDGVDFEYCKNVLIVENDFSGSYWGSIYLGSRTRNENFTICKNSLHDNRRALYIDRAYVDVYNNSIFNNEIGVVCDYKTGLYNNSIYNNSEYGLYVYNSIMSNAKYNFWGDPSGPYHETLHPDGLGDNITGPTDFSPWWNGNPGMSTLYSRTFIDYDLDFNQDYNEPGYTLIQDSINNSKNGNRVICNSFKFNENLTIDKEIELIGVNHTIINISSGIGISIVANNVTIENITLHGNSIASSGIMNTNTEIENISVNNIIIMNFTKHGILIDNEYENSEISIKDCLIQNIGSSSTYSNGVLITNTTEVNIDNVTVTSTSNGYYFSEVSDLKLNNSIVNRSQLGIRIVSSSESLIYNNYFSNQNNYYSSGNTNMKWNITEKPGENIIGGDRLGGNFWSDYDGKDLDGDWIGETLLPHGPGDEAPLAFDTVLPRIWQISYPDPTTGDRFTISINTTDERALSHVEVLYGFGVADNNNSAINMGDDVWNITFTIPSDSLTNLLFKITSVDGSNNRNETQVYNLTVIDNDTPELINDLTTLQATTGDDYRFLVEIIDNIEIENVEVEYWFGNNPSQTIDLTYVSNDYWDRRIIIPSDINTTINYRFNITDSSGNWLLTDTFSDDIEDNDLPSLIEDLTPQNATTGDHFEFRINVFDNIEIGFVTIEYWYGSVNHQIEFMQKISGFDYQFQIQVPLDMYLDLSYFIRIVDTSNNIFTSDTYLVDVLDNDIPFFLGDKTGNSATTGELFTFGCEVDDNIETEEVWVEYWYGQGEHNNRSMNYVDENIWTFVITTNHDELVFLHYQFHAKDSSGNWNVSEQYQIILNDNDAPYIDEHNPPQRGFTQYPLNITVDAYDNVEVDSVQISYKYGVGETNVWMMNNTNENTWKITLVIPDTLDLLRYSFIITDTSNNSLSTKMYTVAIFDDVKPEIIEDYSIPEAYTGDEYTFNITVFDNIAINQVIVIFDYGGDPDQLELSGNNGYYVGEITIPSNSLNSLNYYLQVTDTSSNQIKSDSVEIPVMDNDPPSISDVDISGGNPTTGMNFSVSCKIRDNISPSEVYLHYEIGDMIGDLDPSVQNNRYSWWINIPEDYVGNMSIQIFALDSEENTLVDNYNLTVTDSISPWIDTISDVTLIVTQEITIKTSTGDNIGVNEIHWTSTGINHIGSSLVYNSTNSGEITVTVEVVDLKGNKASTTFIITNLPVDHDTGAIPFIR